jgi:acyl-CoA synthetase (AMP-forming)/AMP-acid ligase II
MNLHLTPIRFLRHAEQQFPQKTAVVCQGVRFSYRKFGDRVGCLAGALRAEFLRSRLVHYKCPHSIEFCDSLPKTATGKVLKGELRNNHALGTAWLQSDAS